VDLTANPLEIVAIVLAAVIPVCIAYLFNCRFQRQFALTEKLWDEKYKGLKAVQNQMSILYSVVCDIEAMHQAISDNTKTNIETHSAFQFSVDSLKKVGVPVDDSLKLDKFKPQEFDKKKASSLLVDLLISIPNFLNGRAQEIEREFAGLSLILEDTSLRRIALDFMKSVSSSLAAPYKKEFDMKTARGAVLSKMYEFDKKAVRELYITKKSKLTDMKEETEPFTLNGVRYGDNNSR